MSLAAILAMRQGHRKTSGKVAAVSAAHLQGLEAAWDGFFSRERFGRLQHNFLIYKPIYVVVIYCSCVVSSKVRISLVTISHSPSIDKLLVAANH